MVKNLFITGGLGQDGKIIYKLLKRKKLNISIITKSKEVNVDKKIDYKILNLLNKKKIETIFKKKKTRYCSSPGFKQPLSFRK